MRAFTISSVSPPVQDRDACIAMVDALIEKFQRAGLLNDESYLRGSITSLRRRGLSARAIEAKLAAKGLRQGDIKAGLLADEAETGAADADLTAALRLARKKRIGPFLRQDVQADGEKAMAALARAGFDYETARKALGMSLGEAEEVLEL
jgi:regulatory protein